MAINKKSFLADIKRRVYTGVKEVGRTAKTYKGAYESNKAAKQNIDKLARKKVKKNIRGGESQEQLQREFMKERKKIRKKFGY